MRQAGFAGQHTGELLTPESFLHAATLPCVQQEAGRLNGRPCQLIATEASHAEGPRLLYILQRWLPLVLHIRRELRCLFARRLGLGWIANCRSLVWLVRQLANQARCA